MASSKIAKEEIEVYKKSCKGLVERKGDCEDINCANCPFTLVNNGYNIDCIRLGAAASETTDRGEDLILVENAQKFLDGIIIFHNGKLVEIED